MPSATSRQHHWDLAQLLKQFREEAGKTQEQLAQELNEHDSLKQHRRTISRSAINRIEKGHASLRPILAAALDEYAKDNGLASPGFSFLVMNRKIRETTHERISHIDRILRTRDYSKLYLVVCDVFDFAHCLKSALPTPELHTTVIVPTKNRSYELFGGAAGNEVSRPELFDGYADSLNRHIDDQIHLIHGVCDRSREAQLEVFESSLVLNSVVLTRGDRETRCVYWPSAPFGSMQFEPNLVPVVDDAAVSAWYETLILGTIRKESVASQLHLGDAFVVSEDETSSDDSRYVPTDRPTFSKFYPKKVRGEETERDREGAAVALIMPYVPVLRGGKQDVQVLLQWRSPMSTDEVTSRDGQMAFVATRVYSSMVWKAIDDIGYDSYRRHGLQYLEDQSKDVLELIQEQTPSTDRSQNKDGQESIIECAYRNAVTEHLRLTYGIDCHTDTLMDRIESSNVMNIRVAKGYGANIVSRLFFLRLNPGERDSMIRSAGRYADTEIRAIGIGALLELIRPPDRPTESGQYNDCLGLALEDKQLSKDFARALVALKDRWVTP